MTMAIEISNSYHPPLAPPVEGGGALRGRRILLRVSLRLLEALRVVIELRPSAEHPSPLAGDDRVRRI
jgi:hypothetical protein